MLIKDTSNHLVSTLCLKSFPLNKFGLDRTVPGTKTYFICMREMKENDIPSLKSADMFFSGHQVTSVRPTVLILHERTSAATHYNETMS